MELDISTPVIVPKLRQRQLKSPTPCGIMAQDPGVANGGSLMASGDASIRLSNDGSYDDPQ